MPISDAMKNFVAKIILLFLIIGVCDFLFGKAMDYMIDQIKVGGQGRDNYICNFATDDILVFGSSRAMHHYNSQMLEDSLGMTCYNCGDDGHGIILSYGRLKMVRERHLPKIIIQDVSTGYDLFKNDNHQFLGLLKQRYDREGISEIFDMVDKTERYKMLSHLYRYNSKFLQNIFVFFTGKSADVNIKGYKPVYKEMDTLKVVKNRKEEEYEFDSLKLDVVRKFIDLSDGAQLFFVVSPVWYGIKDTCRIAPAREMCQKFNIPFIDFSNDPKYVHNNVYFKDGTHLNARGADEFTRDLIKKLKKAMRQDE